MATEEEVKLAERLQKILNDIKANKEEDAKLSEEIKKLSEDQIKSLLQISSLNETIKAQLKQQLANEQDLAEKLNVRIVAMKKYNQGLKEAIEGSKSQYSQAVMTEELHKSVLETRRLEIRALKQQMKDSLMKQRQNSFFYS